MFVDVFSLIFRYDTIFIKNENAYSCYIDPGGSTRCYFVDFKYNSGNTCFSAGAFLMNSFQDFNGKSYTLVGPKSSKQWKSLCESDISCFLCFFRVFGIQRNVRKP